MGNMPGRGRNPMKSVQEVTRDHKNHDWGVAKCHRIPAVTHAQPLQNGWDSFVNAAKRSRKRERRDLTCRFACPGGTAASKWINSGAGSEKSIRKSAAEVTRSDWKHARDSEESHGIGPGSHPGSQETCPGSCKMPQDPCRDPCTTTAKHVGFVGKCSKTLPQA